MIRSHSIPLTAKKFIRACKDDVTEGRYAPTDNYRAYLIEVTKRKDPRLLSYLRVPDRQTGMPRYSADVDHIIPQTVWSILMSGVAQPPNGANAFNAISNLFWRDPHCNRSYDQQAIGLIKSDFAKGAINKNTLEGANMRGKWIEIFLRTKRDEGVMFAGEVLDPHLFDEILAADGQSNWLNVG